MFREVLQHISCRILLPSSQQTLQQSYTQFCKPRNKLCTKKLCQDIHQALQRQNILSRITSFATNCDDCESGRWEGVDERHTRRFRAQNRREENGHFFYCARAFLKKHRRLRRCLFKIWYVSLFFRIRSISNQTTTSTPSEHVARNK